jgi:hypothetical protein
VSALRSLALEVRRLAQTIQDESVPEQAGSIVVSGMLCEQLARELGAGAKPGAVIADGSPRLVSAEVLVHVMAAEPSAADESLVRAADREGVPVVLVQLWPQEHWTPPFVLTPFVVECRAGEGFPLTEIGARIADAAEHPAGLARRVPVLHEVISDRIVGTSVLRSALLAVIGSRKGAARPLLALEQVRTLSRIRSLEHEPRSEELPVLAGAGAAAVALSFMLRAGARRARQTLPGPLVNAGIAAGATWALAEAVRRFDRPAA